MTDGRIHPPSFKSPIYSNQPQNTPGVALPKRYDQVLPQTDVACQSGFPPQQKDITQNTFYLLHSPPTTLPPIRSAAYQNAWQQSQFVPEHPSSVPPVLVQETVANTNNTFQNSLPVYHSHSQQRNGNEANPLDAENKQHLLSSHTHVTTPKNSSSKKDVAEIRPWIKIRF